LDFKGRNTEKYRGREEKREEEGKGDERERDRAWKGRE